jgi:type I restriction enzyme M protein
MLQSAAYKNNFKTSFLGFDKYLSERLIKDINNININGEENEISNEIFERMKNNSLMDKYKAYQILDDEWKKISGDIELIQTEGMNTCKNVDSLMELKKKNGEEKEVQIGWQGRIIPFDLMQKYKLNEQVEQVKKLNNRLEEITSMYQETIDALSEDDKEQISELLNDENDAFVNANVAKKAKAINKSSQYGKELDSKIIEINNLIDEEKNLKKEIKLKETKLQKDTKAFIEKLSEDEIQKCLEKKWINPIIKNINKLMEDFVNEFSKKIESLSKKYNFTLLDLEGNIGTTEKELSQLIDDLIGDEFDMKGLNELKLLLNGETYGK